MCTWFDCSSVYLLSSLSLSAPLSSSLLTFTFPLITLGSSMAAFSYFLLLYLSPTPLSTPLPSPFLLTPLTFSLIFTARDGIKQVGADGLAWVVDYSMTDIDAEGWTYAYDFATLIKVPQTKSTYPIADQPRKRTNRLSSSHHPLCNLPLSHHFPHHTTSLITSLPSSHFYPLLNTHLS